MRALIVGGGPGGLYLGMLLKKSHPRHKVCIVERNAPDATFGFGVVFSDETLGYLQENDEPTFREITNTFARWDAIEVRYKGAVIRSEGHGFSGIARKRLLNILQRRCEELGVELRYHTEFEPRAVPRASREYDVVVAADGANSRIRTAYRDVFQPTIDLRRNKYVWFGTTHPFKDFTFAFRESEHGLFWCHAYRYDAGHSTFIVECDPATWGRAGLDRMSEAESMAYCQRVFAEDLEGEPLLSNRSLWINFPMLKNERWRLGENVVLLGDSAHTAHFSIGSGTKLAMEDAIGLAYALEHHASVPAALEAYEDERKRIVERFQRAAFESLYWFEGTQRYTRFEPDQFAFSLLTRSRRISYENLKLRDAALVDRVHARFLQAAGVDVTGESPLRPPMFAPYELRGLKLANRVVVSPMSMYSADDGTPNSWHLVHLGSRAVGGAGLVYAEMTDVSPEGRISPGCTGLYRPEHVARWREIVDFVHQWTPAKVAIQLGHAGRKASTRRLWEGDLLPLPEGNWPVVSASPIPYFWISQIPREIDRAEMDRVREDYVRAARGAAEAGFDLLELHYAHGYLMASFLSPLTNQRTDGYGGSVQNRLRFPLEVFDAVRAVWPAVKPLSVRISATDWAAGGITPDDTVYIARTFKEHGLDLLDVSAGQTVPYQRPVYGRAFQTPFSDHIRNTVNLPTITVGNINTPDELNSILLAGRADLIALARPHLRDPYWTRHAAAAQEYYDLRWPPQYESVQPRPRENPPPKPLVVRLDEDPYGKLADLEQQLAGLARRHYRSLNGEMLAALSAWIERHGQPAPEEVVTSAAETAGVNGTAPTRPLQTDPARRTWG